MKYNFLLRIRLISGFIIVVFLLLIAKLFSVQVLHGKEYSERADRQYVTPVENLFDRGDIFFKKKDGSLVGAASTITGFKVAIVPKLIKDQEQAYLAISSVLTNIDKTDFLRKADKKDDPYEEIGNHLTKEQADKISSQKILGVSVFKEKWRFYPGGELASQTIGFVAYRDNDFLGRYGLERFYNGTLAFAPQKLYVNFFAEVFSTINKAFFDNGKKEGDIVSSIEPVVQGFAEKQIGDAVSKWDAMRGGVIIMNPKNGEIIAMASSPTFNLNNFRQSDVSVFSNSLVENVFEFGSVIKPLTMSMGLNEGVITPETKYNDVGQLLIDGHVINNFDKKARGIVSMHEVLNQSLNTGAIFVMKRIGKEKFKSYMLDYGFDKKTGIDLPNEAKNLTSNLNTNRDLEYANASFGQGIALSPVSLVGAFSALANGGFPVTPHLIITIKYRDGGQEELSYPATKQVITKETSDVMSNMLTTVVDKGFNTKQFNLDKWSIAAKTGTAQVAKADGSGYEEDKHQHTIIGYFPSYDPKFLVLYYLIDPKAQYAIESLRDPYLNTAKFLLNYYIIPTDR